MAAAAPAPAVDFQSLVANRDIFVRNILSYLDIFELSKFRAVCSGIKHIVDNMPGAKVLEIHTLNNSRTKPPSTLFKWESDTSAVSIYRSGTRRVPAAIFPHIASPQPQLPLQATRPYAITTPLLHNITELQISGLTSDAALVVHRSFPKVQKLDLYSMKISMEEMIFMILGFPQLTTLSFAMSDATNYQFRLLSILADLPCLTSLRINDCNNVGNRGANDLSEGILFGLSKISQLKILNIVGAYPLPSTCAALLHHLPHLREISLFKADQEFWNTVRAADEQSSQLRKVGLQIELNELTEVGFSCIEHFPSLIHLDLVFSGAYPSDTDIIEALSSLQHHPSLRYLSIKTIDHLQTDFTVELQEALGERIKVTRRD